MPENYDFYYPDFDLAYFRGDVARYVRLLILARWRCEPGFLPDEDIVRWEPLDIHQTVYPAWRLLAMAAEVLARLNTEYIPRCGTGGVLPTDESTPIGRLLPSIGFLAETLGGGPYHNAALLAAAEELQAGESVDWCRLVDWDSLAQIRDDLGQLPLPQSRGATVPAKDEDRRLQARDGVTDAESRRGDAVDQGDSSDQSEFRPRGRDWEIKYRDGPLNVFRHMDGFIYLHALIERTGRPFTAKELRAEKSRFLVAREAQSRGAVAGCAEEDVGSSLFTPSDLGEISDVQARDDYERRLEEIKDRYEEAREFGREDEMASLELERDAIVGELKAATGLRGRDVKMSSPNKVARDTVRNAIDRALQQIQEKDKALALHFCSSYHLKDLFIYSPEDAVVWSL